MAIVEQLESWAASRQHGIGGSDMPAILGMSNWRSPIDVWQSKVKPETVEEIDKECLWFGSALEPVIRERFGMKYNLAVISPADLHRYFTRSHRFESATIVVGDEEWKIGSADGWIPQEASGLEVKNVGFRDKAEWGTEESDEIPAAYLLQVMWYIHVYESKQWYVSPLFHGNTLARYRVRRNETLIKDMVERARQFWNDYVLKQVEPPIDESESYARYLARKFSLSDGVEIRNPSPEVLSATLDLHEADKVIKEYEQRRALANNQLRALIGNADKVRTPLGTVGWVRFDERDTTDWKQLSALLRSKVSDDAYNEAFRGSTKATKRDAYLRAWWKK